MSDDTERTAITPRYSSMNKLLATLLGFLTVVAPCATGYFAWREAKAERETATQQTRSEAAAGYKTVADPVGAMQALLREHDWRIARLEQALIEHDTQTSIAPPPLERPESPVDRARLYRELPKTLDDAAAAK